MIRKIWGVFRNLVMRVQTESGASGLATGPENQPNRKDDGSTPSLSTTGKVKWPGGHPRLEGERASDRCGSRPPPSSMDAQPERPPAPVRSGMALAASVAIDTSGIRQI
jgi:hypothetical protein